MAHYDADIGEGVHSITQLTANRLQTKSTHTDKLKNGKGAGAFYNKQAFRCSRNSIL